MPKVRIKTTFFGGVSSGCIPPRPPSSKVGGSLIFGSIAIMAMAIMAMAIMALLGVDPDPTNPGGSPVPTEVHNS